MSMELDGVVTKYYKSWGSALQRSYDDKLHKKYPTYIGCSVNSEWHNFQNFAKWYEENWKPHMEGWHLDKDVLIKGNKTYSPENCCFVPLEINKLLTKRQSCRGELPLGVSRRNGRFDAKIRVENKLIHLGMFNTPEEAFQAYKIAKETHIKEVAEIWKPKLATKTYEALINYQVEITD